jgi:hypothetical protein
MDMYDVNHFSVSIARDWREVYEFAANPEHLPRWASGLGATLEQIAGEWVAEGPAGRATVRFAERNPFGVLDQFVSLASGQEIYVPLRVIANGPGSEVIFTLFRLPGVSDEQFAADAAWIQRDLETLKRLLEIARG